MVGSGGGGGAMVLDTRRAVSVTRRRFNKATGTNGKYTRGHGVHLRSTLVHHLYALVSPAASS